MEWTSTYGKVTRVYETQDTIWITVEMPKELHPLEEPLKDWLKEEPYWRNL
jgi:hypothetical protein